MTGGRRLHPILTLFSRLTFRLTSPPFPSFLASAHCKILDVFLSSLHIIPVYFPLPTAQQPHGQFPSFQYQIRP